MAHLPALITEAVNKLQVAASAGLSDLRVHTSTNFVVVSAMQRVDSLGVPQQKAVECTSEELVTQ